jgi:hypothetical protein
MDPAREQTIPARLAVGAIFPTRDSRVQDGVATLIVAGERVEDSLGPAVGMIAAILLGSLLWIMSLLAASMLVYL